MSTSLRMASMPAATCASSRSSGPRTAATMQNSVAPDFAVCLAASTRLGMSSQALRTGEANSPDCEQKWQSSGQPPVLRLMMPSTSTSGPHQLHPDLVGQCEQFLELVVGQLQHLQDLVLVEPFAAFEHLLAGQTQHVCDLWGLLRHSALPPAPKNLNGV